MKPNKDYALLEALNLLVALKELGDDFSLPRETLDSLVDVSEGRQLSYFEIVTLLYYIGSSTVYPQIKTRILKGVKSKLSDLSDIRQNSEKVHLLMDVLTCPFIQNSFKDLQVEKLLKQVNQRPPSRVEIEEARVNLGKFSWFISWDGAELMTLLEKKELLKSY